MSAVRRGRASTPPNSFTRITRFYATANTTWAPAGTKIVFSSDEDGDHEIYVMNADGTGRTQLTFNTIEDSRPAWSPDGTRIAFDRGTASAAETWVMNANGTGQTQLTFNGVQDVVARWAPDDSKLLFRREFAFGAGWAELLTMNPDGTGDINITNTATTYEGEGAYSPDGAKIVLNNNESDANFDIYLMNADGSGRVRITNSAGYDGDLDWQATPTIVPAEVSPPGAAIQFTVSKSAPSQLDLAWEAACAPTYRIVSGSLSSLHPSGVTAANASPMVCGIMGTSTSQPMPADSVFLLVAGDSVAGTGPLGNASSGTPREASTSCP